MSAFEKVHTMTAFYDGPRGGIADLEGRPHVYSSLFDESQGYADTFLLMPIQDSLFQLALEDWEIWCRWEKAFHAGTTTQWTHPALPADRARHEELERLIGDRLQPLEPMSRRALAEFRPTDNQGLEVRWIAITI